MTLSEFKRANIESDNYLRQFITGLIVSALRGRSNAG